MLVVPNGVAEATDVPNGAGAPNVDVVDEAVPNGVCPNAPGCAPKGEDVNGVEDIAVLVGAPPNAVGALNDNPPPLLPI